MQQHKVRVNTGYSPTAESPTKNQDVTSELYSQREMDVLRAKIAKRVELEKRLEQESYNKERMFKPEMDAH